MSLKDDAFSAGKMVAGFAAVAAIGTAVSLGVYKGIEVCHDGAKAGVQQVAQIMPQPNPPN